jgi:hypothetical protein
MIHRHDQRKAFNVPESGQERPRAAILRISSADQRQDRAIRDKCHGWRMIAKYNSNHSMFSPFVNQRFESASVPAITKIEKYSHLWEPLKENPIPMSNRSLFDRFHPTEKPVGRLHLVGSKHVDPGKPLVDEIDAIILIHCDTRRQHVACRDISLGAFAYIH